MPERGERRRVGGRLLAGEARELGADQLLDVVLGPGGIPEPGRLSRQLLASFGGLSKLGRAEAAELLAFEGLGPASATRLLACFELGRQLAHPVREERFTIGSPEDVARLLGPAMEGLHQEQFRVLLLDSKHRVLRDVLVAQGGLNAAVVHPREVLRPAILAAAAALVLAHNHPSGDPEPSEEDRRLTARFREACRLIGIELLDHVILGAGCFASLKERGLIP